VLACRENQHHHVAPRSAPPFEPGHAIDSGQAQIEHDRVIKFRVAEKIAFLAVGGDIDDIAGVGECLLQKTLKILIVFDYEDAWLAANQLWSPSACGTCAADAQCPRRSVRER
jgi:hypothetical protein